jgi:Carbohydrate family 9 binding domain-like
MTTLPRLECKHGSLAAVTAQTNAAHWSGIAPVFLKETVTGSQPNQPTSFKTAWDDGELRVLFHATDDDAWATHTAHDAPLYEEEVVEIFLDPTGDLESYFEIEVNPLNAVCDLVLRRSRSGYRKDFAWHCEGLRTAVRKTENAWSAEISIPFASLAPSLPVIGQPWRANFYRIDRPKNSPWELSAWSPTGLPLFHVQEKFGWLDFAI